MRFARLSLTAGVLSLTFASTYAALAASEKQEKSSDSAAVEQAGPLDPRVQLKLAYEFLEAEQFSEALSALYQVEAKDIVALPLIRARALRGLGQNDAALKELQTAVTTFPDEVAAKLELLALCKDLSLKAQARNWGEELLKGTPDKARVLLILEALHTDSAALPLLEKAAALFDQDGEVLYRLGYAYAVAQKYYAAGRLFERATFAGRDASFEAADQFCTAGADRRALSLNSRVKDDEVRLRQRLRILSSSRQFARLVALQPEAERIGLKEARISYYFAYARFRLGQEERATSIARSLLDTRLRSQAVSLLQAMGRPLKSPE